MLGVPPSLATALLVLARAAHSCVFSAVLTALSLVLSRAVSCCLGRVENMRTWRTDYQMAYPDAPQ